jgi:hypothetical protein
MLLAASLGLSARDDLPDLPSPGRLRPGPIQPTSASGKDGPLVHSPGQETQARPFPARAYAALVDDWSAWRSTMLETTNSERERAFRQRMREILPRAAYSFGSDCPLRKTSAVGIIQFRITCLPEAEPFLVQFPRGRDDSVRTQLEMMKPGREILAVVRLLDAELSRQTVRLVFRESSFQYVNQFLERLHELSPGMGEPGMLQPEWVMRHIGSLAGGRRYPDSALSEIGEVLRTGEYYPVSQECPLNLESRDRLDAENTHRLEFTFVCVRGNPTSIRMGERELENESELAGPGKYLGEMRLASALLVDGRLFLDWDAIRNVRAMRKP